VDYALQTGGMMVQNSVVDTSQRSPLSRSTMPAEHLSKAKAPTPNPDLAKAPAPGGGQHTLAKAPAPGGGQHTLAKAPAPGGDSGLAKAPAPGAGLAKAPAPDMPNTQQVAFFGPKSCIQTYLSESGTCLIQTRCAGIDISEFGIGVTCIDRFGDYTRYVFGKGGFQDEEIFDTTLRCSACAGVGDAPAYQLRGILPKTMIQDITSLKAEVKLLRSEVTSLRGKTGRGSGRADAKASSGKAANGKQERVKSGGGEAGNVTGSKKTNASGNTKSSFAAHEGQPAVTRSGTGHDILLGEAVNTATQVLAVKKPQTVKELLRSFMRRGTLPVASDS